MAVMPPKWKFPKRPGDKAGWKVGACGVDGVWDKDSRDWVGTWDKAADRYIYGEPAVGGSEKVMSDDNDPGTLHDDYKGYEGVD
jgi:hypothetical protein